jgi:phosphotriesterase-related protein
LIIGHCGDTTDLEYIEAILGKGSYVGLDRFGLEILCSTKDRADTLIALCRKGYEKQIVLSHDMGYLDWWPPELREPILEKYAPRWSYYHIMEDVLPYIRDKGVSEKQISTMMVENPRRIFTN